MVKQEPSAASPHPQGTPSLRTKLHDRSAHLGVIGMGYVGLPTMVAAAESGFRVTGIDIDEGRVAQVNAGKSYIEDATEATLSPLVRAGRISATSNFAIVHELDVVLVCVPTPITENKEPDLAPMEKAIDGLAAHMRGDQLIVLQSTTFPGTTQEFVLPKLEKTGRQAGKDFYLAFALERIDPGNKKYGVRNVPKVVGGVTSECTLMATTFFSAFVEHVMPVSSPKVAEMTKLLENTFRSVNIALVNELAMLSRRMGIDIWEVIKAASTKPFGFMPFYPGPGVGGHCIPVDPFYLSWKAEEYGFHVNFIQLAAEINDNMPSYTSSCIVEILANQGKPLKDARLLVLGVTFKENITDTRNSPAVRVMELLLREGAEVAYSDRHAPMIAINGISSRSIDLNPIVLQRFDAVVILVNHAYFNLAEIVDNSKLVIDTRNATCALDPRANVVKL
jgi:UDP-N-acetyl-D-glucosamine dehydrogenase